MRRKVSKSRLEAIRRFREKNNINKTETRDPKKPNSQIDYYKSILKEVNLLSSIIDKKIFPILEKIDLENIKFDSSQNNLSKKNLDEDKKIVKFLKKALSFIALNYFGNILQGNDLITSKLRNKLTSSTVKKFIERANKNHSEDFFERFKDIAGTQPLGFNEKGVSVRETGLKDKLQRSLSSNVDLITNLQSDHFNKMKSIVWNGIDKGESGKTIQQKIKKLTGFSKNRAKLIANDQAHKINSQLEMFRLQSNGVNKYVWMTRENAVVRKDHSRLHGKVFSFDDPPVTVTTGKRAGERNNPGEDINCFCWAKPKWEEITGLEN